MTGSKVLGVIPARGGSKGVPRKNTRLIDGKPLIAWTIEAALGAKAIDRVILSSEDSEIIRIAKQFSCEVPFVRDAGLASDHVTNIDVVLDAADRCPGYDWVVLLQPTSPLRTAEDIDRAMAACIEHGAPSCVSVKSSKENPSWMFNLTENLRLNPVLPGPWPERRQELLSVYSLNGAIYIARIDWLRQIKTFISDETIGYLMTDERSIDIDSELDLLQLNTLLEIKKNGHVPTISRN